MYIPLPSGAQWHKVDTPVVNKPSGEAPPGRENDVFFQIGHAKYDVENDLENDLQKQ